MVAISLIVLIGMAVLTFDLGRGVALKRNMVNAADAGALAAARECGLANGEASAMAAATDLVTDNNDAATVTGMEINPDPAVCSGAGNPDPDGQHGHRDGQHAPGVLLRADLRLRRRDRCGHRHRGVDHEMSGPAPLKVEALKVDECLRGGTGSSCYVGYDDVGAQYGMAQLPRGLAGRGRAQPTDGMPVHRRRERPEGLHRADGDGDVGVQYDPWNVPIWVCAKDGANASAQQAIQDWIDLPQRGPQAGRLLPVVAPASSPCPPEGCWPRYGIRMRPTRSSSCRASTSRTCTGVPR